MPFNTPTKLKIFSISYYVIIALLFSAVMATPFLVKDKVLLTERFIIEEDVLEALLIAILVLIGILISSAYQAERRKNRQEMNRLSCEKDDLSDRLADAFHYIGGINVQIQEFRSIFSGLKRYPTSKNDLREVLDLYARKIIGIVNADWVVIRIIDRHNFRTIKEHIAYRKKATLPNKHISNKSIVLNRTMDGYCLVGSRQENLTIKLVCILPEKRLDPEQKILSEAITNQLEMLYIVYTLPSFREIYLSRES